MLERAASSSYCLRGLARPLPLVERLNLSVAEHDPSVDQHVAHVARLGGVDDGRDDVGARRRVQPSEFDDGDVGALAVFEASDFASSPSARAPSIVAIRSTRARRQRVGAVTDLLQQAPPCASP